MQTNSNPFKLSMKTHTGKLWWKWPLIGGALSVRAEWAAMVWAADDAEAVMMMLLLLVLKSLAISRLIAWRLYWFAVHLNATPLSGVWDSGVVAGGGGHLPLLNFGLSENLLVGNFRPKTPNLRLKLKFWAPAILFVKISSCLSEFCLNFAMSATFCAAYFVNPWRRCNFSSKF